MKAAPKPAARPRRGLRPDPPKWRPLLGDELADRVADVAPDDPGAFCLAAVLAAVTDAEIVGRRTQPAPDTPKPARKRRTVTAARGQGARRPKGTE